MNKLYVILGGDGAGKTTVLEKLSSKGAYVVAYENETLKLAHLLKKSISMTPEALSSRQLFALYDIFVSYYDEKIKAAFRAGVVNVFCESYYFKFLAKLQANNCDLTLAQQERWRNLEKPEQIFYINTPPAIAYNRIIAERSIQNNETGGDCLDKEGFVRFQKKLGNYMLTECSYFGVTKINGKRSSEEIADEVYKLIQ